MGKRKQNVNFGEGMAEMGNIGSIISLVFAWIFMLGGIIFGMVLIVYGIMGKTLINDGACQSKSGGDGNCIMGWDEDECNERSGCTWKPYKMTGGHKALYIVGGLFSMLFGVGILLFMRYIRSRVKKNQNFAAVFGGAFLLDSLMPNRY